MRYLQAIAAVIVVITSFSAEAQDKDSRVLPPANPNASQSPEINTVLPPVSVKARPDPLSRSDRRLARLKKSLPFADGDAAPAEDVTDQFRDYVARHADPENAAAEQRKMMERTQLPPGAVPDPSAENSQQQPRPR